MSIPLFKKALPTLEDRWYVVAHQTLTLDIDFRSQLHWGFTELTIVPTRKDLKTILLNCASLLVHRVEVEGTTASFRTEDPYARPRAATPRAIAGSQGLERDEVALGLLTVEIPRSVKVIEIDPNAADTESSRPTRQSSINREAVPKIENLSKDGLLGSQISQEELSYRSLTVKIHFTSRPQPRALQFVGCLDEDKRYPQVYVNSAEISCLFPCLDDLSSKNTWDITVGYPRDTFAKPKQVPGPIKSDIRTFTGQAEWNAIRQSLVDEGNGVIFEQSAYENTVVCVGEEDEESYDVQTDRRTARFLLSDDSVSAARHVGFAVATFESTVLKRLRDHDRHTNSTSAIPITAYTTPKKIDMALNTCIPVAPALDYVADRYHQFPFPSYRICFVDDMAEDLQSLSGLALLSSRLLFPEPVLDPIDDVTRRLVFGVVSQWIGVDLVPKELTDLWVIIGLAYFITDRFLKTLCGENVYQHRQKWTRDFVCRHDHNKPPMGDAGEVLGYNPQLREFFEAKSSLIMFLLHQNITKHAGSTGVEKVAGALMFAAAVSRGEAKVMTTPKFIRACEKKSHRKYDSFFEQWVNGTGFPEFLYSHRFNKKKMAIEMQIKQTQMEEAFTNHEEPSAEEILAEMLQQGRDRIEKDEEDGRHSDRRIFTGPMTVRIQQTDGTPYEQLLEIRDAITRIDIPYSTKFRRNPRVRRRRTTINPLETFNDINPSGIYSLGDVLSREEEIRDWNLAEPSYEMEEIIAQEPYDWIRIDADFEWICRISQLHNSTDSGTRWTMDRTQLQQDRDVVAQLEAVDRLSTFSDDHAVATVMTRTLMDSRYFYGVRIAAAQALAAFKTPTMDTLGPYLLHRAFKTLFCLDGGIVPRPNDFSSRSLYLVRCGLLEALGRTPVAIDSVTTLLYEQLRLNNNATNSFSDAHYVALMMDTLTERLAKGHREQIHIQEADYMGEGNFGWSTKDGSVQKMIHEIELRGSVDTYLPSFQNSLTCAYLRCREILEEAKLTLGNPIRHWAQCLAGGSSEFVRIQAFEVAVRKGSMRQPQFATYFFEALKSSPSPWLRTKLLELLELSIELAAKRSPRNSDTGEADQGLIIEVEQEKIKEEPGGLATKLLKAVWESEEVACMRYNGFWSAATSSQLGLTETNRLLRISTVIEQDAEKGSLHMSWQLPRSWAVESLGDGKLKFRRTGRVRQLYDKRKYEAMELDD